MESTVTSKHNTEIKRKVRLNPKVVQDPQKSYLKGLVTNLKNELPRLIVKSSSPDRSASVLLNKPKTVYSFPHPLNGDCCNIREMIDHLKSSKMLASKFYALVTTQSQPLISCFGDILYNHISNQDNNSIHARVCDNTISDSEKF